MKKYWLHFKTVCKHKWVVFKECCACGIFWQGLVHDMSKFGFTEFVASARHFQGNRSPIDAEKEEVGYSKAWLHHKSHNKHHWEYWTDFDKDGNVVPVRIPDRYIIEMVCDWIGAGKVYSKEEWTQHEPLAYYRKVRAGRHFDKCTEHKITYLLLTIDGYGLKTFHKKCRNAMKYGMIM